jgi:hypothetical protein
LVREQRDPVRRGVRGLIPRVADVLWVAQGRRAMRDVAATLAPDRRAVDRHSG